VLFPDDEITKRMKIDPMDLQKAQAESPIAAEADAVTSPKSSGFT
jgi:DNA-directed RNA polymerase subunit H (RpoH/RPB5)